MVQWLQDRWFLRIVLVGLVVRATLAALVPPGFDEAYYGVFAFHPAWGYFDHPPAVAVTAGIGMWLTGVVTAYTLRIGALLLFLGTSLVLYRLVLEMVNRPAALWSVFLLHVTPYFFYGMGAFVIPDNALGFFWLLTLYFMWKVYQTQNPRWFLAVGASTGLALLAKYHAVLLIGSIGYVLLFYRGWRQYLKTPYPYLGLMLAVLIFLPNILWNAAHQWISYRYQFGKG
ncbi:MAG TPA: glycosyltransferase family 39 protein, partial [Calditrichae bacterium]|nr:glycosyltransferase family 39 protein [Calditrichia bacterium]